MKFLKITLCFTCLILISPAFTSATPIYLNCVIETVARSQIGEEFDNVTGRKSEFSVKLDEASGKVTHTSNGKTLTGLKQFNSEGFFSASSISYQNKFKVDRDSVVTEIYEIDRSSLNVSMTSKVRISGLELNALSKTGTCQIEKTKGNKI